MAKENVQKFFEKVAKDEELQKALSKAEPAQTDAVVAIAKQAGFDFTEEELDAVLQAGKGELSDEALEGVAGGMVDYVKDRWSVYKDGELDPMIELQRKKRSTKGFSYR